MAKYKVLAEVEVLGELRAVGSELEVDEETAAPFVSDGKLELVANEGEAGQGIPPSDPANPTPPAPPADPVPAAPAPAEGEKKAGWVGNHTV
jgi:hypothetical protein